MLLLIKKLLILLFHNKNSRLTILQRNSPNTSSRLERSGMERSHTFALAKVNVS